MPSLILMLMKIAVKSIIFLMGNWLYPLDQSLWRIDFQTTQNLSLCFIDSQLKEVCRTEVLCNMLPESKSHFICARMIFILINFLWILNLAPHFMPSHFKSCNGLNFLMMFPTLLRLKIWVRTPFLTVSSMHQYHQINPFS